MTTMDCKTCHSLLPDLLLPPDLEPASVHAPDSALRAHLATCAECRIALEELRATFALLDDWTAPEPSPYFDARIHAHLREAQRSAPEGVWERWMATLRFSTGRGLRSAVAGVFLFVLLLSGGTVATLLNHHGATPTASPTVNDLRIYDNNAQALQQMDLLDDAGADTGTAAPQS